MLNIFTFADKRPDFIEWQAATLKYFMRDEYRYFVFNNAYNNRRKISDACAAHGAVCIDLPYLAMDHSNPNAACAAPLNWAWKNVIVPSFGNEACLIIDSDMFLVHPLTCTYISATKAVREWGLPLMGVKQRRGHVKYIWNGIIKATRPHFLKELDFNYGEVDGVLTDVGGFTHHFLEKEPDWRRRFGNITHTSHIHPKNNNLHVLPVELLKDYDHEFCMELYDYTFLHYGRGSNWDNQNEDYHTRKTEFLKRALTMAMNKTIKFERYDYVFSEDEWKEK